MRESSDDSLYGPSSSMSVLSEPPIIDLTHLSSTNQQSKSQHHQPQPRSIMSAQPLWDSTQMFKQRRLGPVSSAATRSPERSRRVTSAYGGDRKKIARIESLYGGSVYGSGVNRMYYSVSGAGGLRPKSAYDVTGSYSSDAMHRHSVNNDDVVYRRRLAQKYRELKDILQLDLTLRMPPSAKSCQRIVEVKKIGGRVIAVEKCRPSGMARPPTNHKPVGWRRRRGRRGVMAGDRASEDGSVQVYSDDSWSIAPSLEILECKHFRCTRLLGT